MIPSNAVLDHEYHIVELYRFSQNAIDWCIEKFGPEGYRWFTTSSNNRKIYFADPKDHLMFTLRWS
mgnify:CR=1 FL=1|jgi:hypothetical protein